MLRLLASSRCWSLLATIALTVYLYIRVPKGFFPQQDTGRLTGIQADQDTSFQAMDNMLRADDRHRRRRPGVDTVNGFTGGGGGGATNAARMFISLKPLERAKDRRADQIIARLRPKLGAVPGATLYLQAVAGSARRRPVEQRRSINSPCAATTCRI